MKEEFVAGHLVEGLHALRFPFKIRGIIVSHYLS